jgi:hypothetical protein
MSPRTVALAALLLAATASHSADAQGLAPRVREALHGGATADGWGVTSTETDFVSGEFVLRLPAGATVRSAWLLSGTRTNRANNPIVPPVQDTPRTVVLGRAPNTVVRVLEGRPDVVPPASLLGYGTFVTDATAVVRALAATSSGGDLRVPVRERGDNAADRTSMGGPQIMGHALVATYEHPGAPLRDVLVYAGCVVPPGVNQVRVAELALPAPVARCAAGEAGAEPAALSLTVFSEADVCEEMNTLIAGTTTISTGVGGYDDWAEAPRPYCVPGGVQSTSGMVTTGSFGGADGAARTPAGVATPLDGDYFGNTPMSSRKAAELWDLEATVLPPGATGLSLDFVGRGAEVVAAVVLQVRAVDDADGDGYDDQAEGFCAQVDTDADGTPDYRDPDSDDDCVPDRMETASGRVDPALPPGPRCPADAGPDAGPDASGVDAGLRFRGSGCSCGVVPRAQIEAGWLGLAAAVLAARRRRRSKS